MTPIPIPIATFLAGSLLTLLLPVGVFLAVAFWYVRFVVPASGTELEQPAAETRSVAADALSQNAVLGREGSDPLS